MVNPLLVHRIFVCRRLPACLCPAAVIGAGLLSVVAFAAEPAHSPLRAELYREGWIDFNKNGRRDAFEDPSQPVEMRVEDLLSQMSLEEKTAQLATLYGYPRVLKDPLPTPDWKKQVWKDGIANIDEHLNGIGSGGRVPPDDHIWPPANHVRARNEVQRWFVEETRLGIPVDFTNEGIRGICHRRATNFPAPIAVGASFDADLAAAIAEVTVREGRALGYTNIYAPIVDLARDPRWGRVVECLGEDPHHVTELGLRIATAIRDGGLASTAKHFAVYSEPKGGRDGQARTDPHVAPREMEMLHLWPYERLVREAGLLGVMSSYNDYDGIPVSGSREMLIDRLRTQWGFRGYVVSDSNAVQYLHNKHRVAATLDDALAMFLVEGGNVRTEFNPPENFILPVRAMVRDGRIPQAVIDDRVRDVLRVKFLIGLFDQPYADPAAADAVIRTPAHRELALQAAREGIVLLKNKDGALPLSKNVKRLLVCGPAATLTETSIDRYGPTGGEVISILDGIKSAVGPSTEVMYASGCDIVDARWPESELYPEPPQGEDAARIAEAVEQARHADAVVVVLGDSNATIGEAKSRTSLDLPGFQNELVRALHATGRPIVVVLTTGRPATINWIDRYVPAVVQAWFGGEAAGRAVADVLFGDYNPGGRLPVTFPRSVGQLPFNFPAKPGSQAGQSRTFDPNGFGSSMAEGALYPFAHGLSYTTFSYRDLVVTPAVTTAGGTVTLRAIIENTGSRPGDEVVQLYVQDEVSSVTTYDLNLRGFQRVRLQPGEAREVVFTLPVRAMELIDRAGRRVVEPGEFKVWLGASSADLRLEGRYTVAP